MTHIEKLHLEAIQNDKSVRKQLCVNDFGTSKLEMIVAEKSAEITEQIAIEFAQWVDRNKFNIFNLSFKELFQEYLKSKENEQKKEG